MFSVPKNSELKLGDTPWHHAHRIKMINEQIKARGIRTASVLSAMENVLRHRFVDENLEQTAYDDTPLPIQEGQTISQPFIVAYMTEALQLQGSERILEVGTGSGYQAAVLAEIVKEVFTIEINENLVINAVRRFKKLGYKNIRARYGDGYKGWPEHAPFDGIVVTAAPNHIPQPLVDQLKVGGRLVIPVGEAYQDLLVVTKLPDGSVRTDTKIPVRFVPMIGEAEKRD